MHHTGITKPHTLVLSVPMFPPYLPKYLLKITYLLKHIHLPINFCCQLKSLRCYNVVNSWGKIVQIYYTFSKYFGLTGLTIKCNAAPTLISPAMVYMVLL